MALIRRIVFLALVSILSSAAFIPSPANADEDEPIHASGDKEVWNRATNKVELIGHASVHQPGESLSADYIVLDQNLRTVDAHGNCVYIANDSVIFGEEMHFNLDTRTGTVIQGRVTNDKFTLSGERINKLGAGRFQTHWGDYSTCRDCAQSWTISARDVDMQVDGYAYMSDLKIKVKDESTMWLPYLVLPMKSRRQTGFLFPKYSISSNNGLMFVEPFFWAVNRSVDFTVGLGRYSLRGDRAELEGRYVLTPRSRGQLNFFYLNDQEFIDPNGDGRYNPSGNPNRWAVEGNLVHEITPNLEMKIKLSEVSDNQYPFRFNDLTTPQDQFLTSSANLAYSNSDVDANLGVSRFRNLLNVNPDPRQFDSTTVQAFPSLTATTRDRLLFGTPLAAGLSVGATNFTRSDGAFDFDSIKSAYDIPASLGGSLPPANYTSGTDPIRKATRFSVSPSLYTVLTPAEGISLVPSIQYFQYFYDFHEAVQSLPRGYALAQLDLVTQFEKIYDLDDPSTPRRKHLIRPLLTYSYIPVIQDESYHPFVKQIAYANNNNLLGYNFDDNDIIPISTVSSQSTYFTPLGNSLTYGFKTQIMDRHETLLADGKPDPNTPATYRIPVELTASNTFNIYDFREQPVSAQGQKQPFTLAQVNLITNYKDKVTTNSTYYYNPALPGIRSAFFSNVSWIFERAMHQRILYFDRSVVFAYNWDQRGYTGTSYENISSGTDAVSVTLNFSLSDYIFPSISYGYDFEAGHKDKGYTFQLAIQSPSQCWKITTGFSFDPNMGHNINPPSFALNLVGNGFEGVSDATATPSH